MGYIASLIPHHQSYQQQEALQIRMGLIAALCGASKLVTSRQQGLLEDIIGG